MRGDDEAPPAVPRETPEAEAVPDVIIDNKGDRPLSVSEAIAYSNTMATLHKSNGGKMRYGQAWFAALTEVRPDLAEALAGRECDPYYKTDNVFAARAYLLENCQ